MWKYGVGSQGHWGASAHELQSGECPHWACELPSQTSPQLCSGHTHLSRWDPCPAHGGGSGWGRDLVCQRSLDRTPKVEELKSTGWHFCFLHPEALCYQDPYNWLSGESG